MAIGKIDDLQPGDSVELTNDYVCKPLVSGDVGIFNKMATGWTAVVNFNGDKRVVRADCIRKCAPLKIFDGRML